MARTKVVNGQVVELTAEEEAARDAEEKAWEDGAADRAMAALRAERNAKLAASDWTQSRDVNLSNDAEWQTYREALRRMPETETDFSNPTWPKEPK